uniref:Uncharacterized protein n=1 Tax=Rhizophora mucronata TaxID=61149 RepID=A0A2P2MZS1_RHIMU
MAELPAVRQPVFGQSGCRDWASGELLVLHKFWRNEESFRGGGEEAISVSSPENNSRVLNAGGFFNL